jgi:hypothetical protein
MWGANRTPCIPPHPARPRLEQGNHPLGRARGNQRAPRDAVACRVHQQQRGGLGVSGRSLGVCV